MVELSLHEVQWSREQGHPVAILQVGGETAGNLSIVLSPGDAQLLAPRPPSSVVERLRVYGLLEAALAAFDAALHHVRLRLDPGMVLTGDLVYRAEQREVVMPATFADALVLAARAGVPMLIAEHDLRWIRAIQVPTATVADPTGMPMARAISTFIESLHIDDL
jgi:bifunctional DNase/RNase